MERTQVDIMRARTPAEERGAYTATNEATKATAMVQAAEVWTETGMTPRQLVERICHFENMANDLGARAHGITEILKKVLGSLEHAHAMLQANGAYKVPGGTSAYAMHKAAISEGKCMMPEVPTNVVRR